MRRLRRIGDLALVLCVVGAVFWAIYAATGLIGIVALVCLMGVGLLAHFYLIKVGNSPTLGFND